MATADTIERGLTPSSCARRLIRCRNQPPLGSAVLSACLSFSPCLSPHNAVESIQQNSFRLYIEGFWMRSEMCDHHRSLWRDIEKLTVNADAAVGAQIVAVLMPPQGSLFG
jgi:hypothetical protein